MVLVNTARASSGSCDVPQSFLPSRQKPQPLSLSSQGGYSSPTSSAMLLALPRPFHGWTSITGTVEQNLLEHFACGCTRALELGITGWAVPFFIIFLVTPRVELALLGDPQDWLVSKIPLLPSESSQVRKQFSNGIVETTKHNNDKSRNKTFQGK